MALLSSKCIMSAMAVLWFLLMVARWHQVNAQIDLEQDRRHQLSVASISWMDFNKPDHLSQHQDREGWQQPPLPVNTNNRKRPRFRVPGRPNQPSAQPVQDTNHPRYSNHRDNIHAEDKDRQEQDEPEHSAEEVNPREPPADDNSFKLLRTFDEDGVHVPLSILRAFQQPKSVANLPRSAKSIPDRPPIDDHVISPINSNTQLKHGLPSGTRQAAPEANHQPAQLSRARNRLAPVPKAVDSHSGSYGLTAASVYARSQPSLRRINQEPREVERPRPYRQRPISPSTVAPRRAEDETNEPINTETETETEFQYIDTATSTSSRKRDKISRVQPDDSEEVVNEEETEDVKKGPPKVVKILPESSPSSPDHTLTDIKSLLRNAAPQSLSEILQQKGMKLSDLLKGGQALSAVKLNPESTTTIPKTTASPQPEATLVDIKSLLRSSGSQSLSEILQQKGMKLSDLLKGGQTLSSLKLNLESTTAMPKTTTSSPPEASPVDIKSLLRSTGSQSLSEVLQQKGMKLSDLLKGGQPLSSIKVITTTSKPPLKPIPSAQPISIRELLASAKVSLTDVVKKPSTGSDTRPILPLAKPISVQDLLDSSPTIKPGVKRPKPFVPGRSQKFSVPTSTTQSTIEIIEENRAASSSPSPKVYKDTSHLEPLVFGGGAAESTTTRPLASSPRPYIAANNVGEYGTHIISKDDDEENNPVPASGNVVSYGTYNHHGNRRPIATSRLTPAPPRTVKRRPVYTYNYSALSEEDYSDSEETVETTPLILTHFNEEEMREDEEPYFNLPLSVRNALTFSFYIAGFSLFVFLVIFVLFKVRQKSRIRLRYPLALLVKTKNNSTTDVSTSDVSTPNPRPKRVSSRASTYAKLPHRSNSLWGTLRRSVKQMENT